MYCLTRLPLSGVVAIAAAWPILAATALYVAAQLYTRWLNWRAAAGPAVSFYSIRINLVSAGAAIVLGVPPLALVAAWWLLRCVG